MTEQDWIKKFAFKASEENFSSLKKSSFWRSAIIFLEIFYQTAQTKSRFEQTTLSIP